MSTRHISTESPPGKRVKIQRSKPSAAKRVKIQRSKPSAAKPKPACVLLVDSSRRPASVMLLRDEQGNLGPISGKFKATEDPFTVVATACDNALGWRPSKGSVLGAVTIARSHAKVFVCPVDGQRLGPNPKATALVRTPIHDLQKLQKEQKLFPKLQFANKEEMLKLQQLAASMPLVQIEDLL